MRYFVLYTKYSEIPMKFYFIFIMIGNCSLEHQKKVFLLYILAIVTDLFAVFLICGSKS
jgi:hypothetical protein